MAELVTKVVTPEVEERKAQLRRLGIASYTISGLSEDESIASDLRAKRSGVFVAVRSEFYKRNAKNKSFRIFPIDPERPSIPMGYSGAPSFDFKSTELDPRDTAIAELRKTAASKGVKLIIKKINDDEFTYKAIKEVE